MTSVTSHSLNVTSLRPFLHHLPDIAYNNGCGNIFSDGKSIFQPNGSHWRQISLLRNIRGMLPANVAMASFSLDDEFRASFKSEDGAKNDLSPMGDALDHKRKASGFNN